MWAAIARSDVTKINAKGKLMPLGAANATPVET